MAATTGPAVKRPFVRDILGRSDFAIISGLIEPGTSVLDLGCGEGELLEWLAANKNVEGRGIEISSSRVQRAIARGISVYQGDIDQGLNSYPPDLFDYAILSQTLQETHRRLQVVRDMLRVARKAIVAFPNFGHWKVRWSLIRTGRAPKTDRFTHDWYDSPNIHIFTIKDFEDLCRQEHLRIERRLFLAGDRSVTVRPNLLAEVAVYLLQR